jgi:hypothetical protein
MHYTEHVKNNTIIHKLGKEISLLNVIIIERQFCVRVVPTEAGQVMPEACRGNELQ